jgi:hypothetical protein
MRILIQFDLIYLDYKTINQLSILTMFFLEPFGLTVMVGTDIYFVTGLVALVIKPLEVAVTIVGISVTSLWLLFFFE